MLNLIKGHRLFKPRSFSNQTEKLLLTKVIQVSRAFQGVSELMTSSG